MTWISASFATEGNSDSLDPLPNRLAKTEGAKKSPEKYRLGFYRNID